MSTLKSKILPQPARPSTLSLGLSPSREVLISWTNNTTNTIGYNIYRTTNLSKPYKKVKFVKFKDISGNFIKSTTDKPGVKGKIYYMLRAVNGLPGRANQQIESSGITQNILIL